MKTYSEEQGDKNFDWRIALSEPNPVWHQLNHKAADWVTCACGNQCAAIPRHEDGTPEDEELQKLGISFYNSIIQADATAAKHILNQIEHRSAFLLSQMGYEEEINDPNQLNFEF